jgi:hypothetical protein
MAGWFRTGDLILGYTYPPLSFDSLRISTLCRRKEEKNTVRNNYVMIYVINYVFNYVF